MFDFIERILLLIIILGICYYYVEKSLAHWRIKKYIKKASKRDIRVLETLQEQGYNIVDVCPPRKIIYFKDYSSREDMIEPKLVVKFSGKKYLVETYSPSQGFSLRDNLIKLKIILDYVCYNINGVLFINSKGQAIKECKLKIITPNYFITLLKKIIILIAFMTLGFYLSKKLI
ncbi:hypothetical protein [Anaerobranca gottschalkii]|uniref:Uncharacterized protein n=1 Tax=Anaerobranca gottschalkii DSM 13577 TaxID=1120990 RepID=A0A1H9Y1W0_9FIRM|nr:hypothetical protein [Anaerobranca gottschalkii]SES62754.1 hypothetical protein SAMN03080614_100181 [Anaerobranca gottschalkii DSM 13577]